MIREISSALAQELFSRLPKDRQIATLSPTYVCADAARCKDAQPRFLLYEDSRGFWMHGVHWTAIPGCEDRFDIQSPYGYGGPVSDCDDAAFRDDAWRCYQVWCRERAAVVEFVRLHPLAPWQNYPGVIVSDRQTVVIDLEEGHPRERYKSAVMRQCRKAEKLGLVVREYSVASITREFAAFYREGMVNLGASPFYLFSDEYFHALGGLVGIHLFVCERDQVWMAAGLFLSCGACLEYHLGATTTDGRLAGAMSLLFDHAANFGKLTGHRLLYLGGGTDGRADNPLLRFKAGFSPLRRLYSYGYALHDPEFYKSLRAKCPDVNRVLFYR